MRLDSVTGSGADTSGRNEVVRIVGEQLGDLVLVPSYVVAQVPLEILSINKHSIDGELYTLVIEATDVTQHLVLEVRARRNIDCT